MAMPGNYPKENLLHSENYFIKIRVVLGPQKYPVEEV